jgi:hypothetical protein
MSVEEIMAEIRRCSFTELARVLTFQRIIRPPEQNVHRKPANIEIHVGKPNSL